MTPTPEMIEAAARARVPDFDALPMLVKNAALHSAERDLKAALAAMWKPIEEAPKDGSDVLLFIPKIGYRPARIDRGKYCDDQYSKKPRPYWTNGADGFRVSDARAAQPTHFAPLSIFEDRK